MPATGGEPERITQNARYGRTKWSPDGKKLYFQRRGRNIWEISLDDKTERQLTDLSIVGSASMNQYATDGRYSYFIWQKQVGDIWMMDVEKEKEPSVTAILLIGGLGLMLLVWAYLNLRHKRQQNRALHT